MRVACRYAMPRWLKFSAVGAIGIEVQLAVLALFHTVLGIPYLTATAMAVETAVLHNFLWHQRWTWGDRGHAGEALARLLRFNLSAGLVSIATNVLLMRWLVGAHRAPYLAANLLCIGVSSIGNFLLADRVVFPPTIGARKPGLGRALAERGGGYR